MKQVASVLPPMICSDEGLRDGFDDEDAVKVGQLRLRMKHTRNNTGSHSGSNTGNSSNRNGNGTGNNVPTGDNTNGILLLVLLAGSGIIAYSLYREKGAAAR